MGLGLDRLVCWLLDIYNIRDAVLYPRAYGLLEPWNYLSIYMYSIYSLPFYYLNEYVL